MVETIKIKILCVEDEQEIRDTMAEILRDEGFEVIEAVNGRLGFQAFLQHQPNIIISDIMMPELDGYGMLKMIRESKDKNNNVPFIFLSALGQKENIIKGTNLFANDYLVKPIDFDILIAKIKEKSTNSIKLKTIHETKIKNIKNQISEILPSEIFSHLESISQMLKILKEEPYGPFPHRRYLEDINKLYADTIRLKIIVMNSLDQGVIDARLNADEEIFSLVDFIDGAVANLPEKIKTRVVFETPYEGNLLPTIKMEKSVLIELMKKIIIGVVKPEQDSSIAISVMIDTLNQFVIIFYISSKLDITGVESSIDCAAIQKVTNTQGCYFKISPSNNKEGEVNATFTIPSHRLIASEVPLFKS